MGARQKLNAIYITVCSLAAALGLALWSWAAFALALAVGLALEAARWRDQVYWSATRGQAGAVLDLRELGDDSPRRGT